MATTTAIPARRSTRLKTQPQPPPEPKLPSTEPESEPEPESSQARPKAAPRSRLPKTKTPAKAPTTAAQQRTHPRKRVQPEGDSQTGKRARRGKNDKAANEKDEEDTPTQEEDLASSSASDHSSSSSSPPSPSTTSTTTSTPSSAPNILIQGVRTGLGPGHEVIVRKPQARHAGSTPYRDHTIHPNTKLFLTELIENNNRGWFKSQDLNYRAAAADFASYVDVLTDRLTGIDDEIPELPAKDIIFRIYRDTRFSKNKIPYKPFLSGAWSRTGRKGPYGMYYLQMGPNRNLIAGGVWNPEREQLARVREDLIRPDCPIRDLLSSEAMRKNFFPHLPQSGSGETPLRELVGDELVRMNAESALKTRPKGYGPDAPELKLLRLRSFALFVGLTDQEVQNVEKVCEVFKAMAPYVQYMNTVVMPDEDGDGGENGEGEGDDAEEEDDSE